MIIQSCLKQFSEVPHVMEVQRLGTHSRNSRSHYLTPSRTFAPPPISATADVNLAAETLIY